MTVGGDFVPGDGREFEVAPEYPVVFGVRLTPRVQGIVIALAGLAGSVYLLVNVVQPTWIKNQELSADVADKENQLRNQADTQRQIQEARGRLRDAEKLRADVLSLFATQDSLDTLLLDINERVQAVNAGITDPSRRATLSKFIAVSGASGAAATPGVPTTEVINDSSLGAGVNGRLQQRVYNVEMEGSFAQTASIIRNVERLQPLLLVQNFKSDLDPETEVLRIDDRGRLIPPSQQTPARLTTSFRLTALSPVEQPAVPPTTAAPGTASPAPSP